MAGNKKLMTIIGEEGTGDGNRESGRLGVQNRVGTMVNHLGKSSYSVTSDSRLGNRKEWNSNNLCHQIINFGLFAILSVNLGFPQTIHSLSTFFPQIDRRFSTGQSGFFHRQNEGIGFSSFQTF